MELVSESSNGIQQVAVPLHPISVNQDREATLRRITVAPSQGSEPDIDVVISKATAWRHFGLDVIPVIFGTTEAAVSAKHWLANQSDSAIDAHWTEHPDHELGFVVGESQIVFRVHDRESEEALVAVMKTFEIWPALSVKSAAGTDFYFCRAKRTSTAPISGPAQRRQGHIDILADDTIVLLPPCRGRTVSIAASSSSELTEVGQAFIDAILQHNANTCLLYTSPSPRD